MEVSELTDFPLLEAEDNFVIPVEAEGVGELGGGV
jgi:hypothetical protein